MRPADERYFERIESRLDEAFERAEAARSQGWDPQVDVEIPVAKDMADRVENILEIPGVAERVRELEGEMSREEAALALVTDFVEGSVGEYESKAGKIEGAVRTAVALLTEGVVAAPIEGIDRVEVLTNDDGTEFVNVYYAGPIRSAGGTAQALSVLVADYARTLLDIDEYKARTEEVERYVEEVTLYDKDTGLQYSPKDKETRFIARNMPIMLDGEATGDEEVSGYRDLERVDTNNPRGGMCLVLAEGIALKAPKIQRYTRKLDEVDWPWLQDLIDGTIGDDDAETDSAAVEPDDATEDDHAADDEPAGPPRVDPATKFLRDLIAGRPVFGHPSMPGGFRLRYGRARNHGFATAGVHPATMHLVDDFLATGTQIKTERPGKAAGVVPVDSIEGPTVRLANGDVRRIDDPAEALEIRNGVEAILDLGEYLVNYGEFVENNHPLAPASYTVEWWRQDFAHAGGDLQALEDDPHVDLATPTEAEAFAWATDYDCPLHPAYTYLWHDVSVEEFEALADAVDAGHVESASADDGAATTDGGVALRPDGTDLGGVLVLPRTEPTTRALESLLVEHRQTDEELRVPTWGLFVRSLGFSPDLERTWETLSAEARTWADGDNAVAAVNEVAPFRIRERAPTRIGARMGRPEKSESRDLSPAVHTLFPISEAGGSQRDVSAAAQKRSDDGRRGRVDVQLGRRLCPGCGGHTYKSRCPDCATHTEPHYECDDCGQVVEPDDAGRVHCARCDRDITAAGWQSVDLKTELDAALADVGERESSFDILKGVKGLMSSNKTPEPIQKGVLRAKHGVTSFKDGTVRYDMTDLPVTAVRPAELDVSAADLRELGYETDVDGDPLQFDDQLVELKVQDVVLSDGAAEHMLRTADFVDDLLTEFYDLPPFYDVDEREDLVGELVFGMAPHTSAAVVGRVVGFTSAAVGYAHPYFHAAKRRNCDGDEDCVMLLMDGLLNFSKEFLPDKRGGSVTEDSRLVAVDPDDNVRFLTFEEFWNELEAPLEVDGKFRKRTCYDEGWRTYAFDDAHEASLQPIEKAIRYRSSPEDDLVRVETQFGRSLDITEHHSLFRYDDGVEEVAGGDLEPGDLVVAPRRLCVETSETRIDVLDAVDDPYVFIDDSVERVLTEAWNDAERGDDVRVAFDGGLAYRLSKRKIGRERLETLLESADRDDEGSAELPDDLQIGIRGSAHGIDRFVDLDEEFAWLLGMFVAEGSLSGARPTIHNADESLVERVSETAEHALGTAPTVRWSNRSYEVSFPAVFREVLYDLGFANQESYHASDKVVPERVLDAPDDVALAFLRGYIAGDGSESSNDNNTTIGFHTTSEDVKDGLVFLLHRFGVVPTTSRRERDAPRRPIYHVTVSGGASDNPLRRLLDGEDPYLPKSLVVTVPDALLELRRMDIDGIARHVPKYLKRRENVSLGKLCEIVGELDRMDLPDEAASLLDSLRPVVDGDLSFLRVASVDRVEYDGHLYDLQVGGEPVFTANWLYAHNSMDAPLVMSSRIDPTEIDDEAHNVDIVREYPREFYLASLELADPESVDITIAEETLDTDHEYHGFEHSHDTSNIALGPDLSAYKTLGSMMEKMDAQLELARKLRAVDETDVAERVIEYHFLPDLIGNLRAFSRQETRCLDCGTKYRRVPLTGDCRDCGGRVNLTVHQGSVNKYMEPAIRVAEEYDCRPYTKQRLEVLKKSIESVFENDKNKQSGIADFM